MHSVSSAQDRPCPGTSTTGTNPPMHEQARRVPLPDWSGYLVGKVTILAFERTGWI